MRRTLPAALLLLALAACGAPATPSPGATTAAAGDLPDGWRWESYGGVEVGIPGDWGWDNGSQRLGQWCVRDQPGPPAVGRPGMSTAVGCSATGSPATGSPAPHTLVTNTGPIVAFESTGDRTDGVTREGDRVTVRRAGTAVIVQAAAAVRDRIVATIRPAPRDSFGCTATHPISSTPSYRPAEPAAVTGRTSVTSVSACKYTLPRVPGDKDRAGLSLYSALRLDGPAAQQAVRTVAAAPAGGGPDAPGQCLPESSYGDDAIVLTVRSAAGDSEIVLRYSGCDHNGFDDGVTVRALTADAVRPFIAGPNEVLSYSDGPGKSEILGH
jgi:hypothetical protein